MPRLDWRLVLGSLASLIAAAVLALPQGRLDSTSDPRADARTPAPDFDICAMLDDLLGERTGELPGLTRDDDVAVERTMEIRHPHRSRRSCMLGENDVAFGQDHLRFTKVMLTVTTMTDREDALARMESQFTRVAGPIGAGALIDIGKDRSSLSNFIMDDNDMTIPPAVRHRPTPRRRLHHVRRH